MSATRRTFLGASAAVAAHVALGHPGPVNAQPTPDGATPLPRAGRIKQSVSRWCYDKIPLPELCRAGKAMGLVAIDLLQPADWDVVNREGLVCSMGYPTERRDFLRTGFTNAANHAMLLKELEATLPMAKAKGVPNVIAMFGNRDGRSDREAIANAIVGLKRIAPLAEESGVTVCVELLNSKVDHKDYHGDHTWFGVEVMQGVGSPRVKLLDDLYHMAIMEGDVIRTIRDNAPYIGHFHTGGVPGRNELDDTQEINWRAVMRAIAGTGYQGYVAHEFVPTRDPLLSLREAVTLCDV